MAGRPPRQWLLIGVVCGLLAVVVLRSAVAVLAGSLKLVARARGPGAAVALPPRAT